MDRAPVVVPLQTGLKVVDALIPIGRGQRELILGDRQTGKTAIAIDTILNQRGQNVLCVYCAIGQRASAVAKVVAKLREKGAMDYTVVVVAEGNDAPGLAYVTPYAATSIAEYFMEKGRDVLIVYDDLTQHARSYRELSLLLRRPPGREAFPGDIFYIHSRLLERATHLSKERGGGSLTALPIIETDAQDISAYIPTNLISITDGQIYLSPTLFELGVLPAVDVGKSVSRVGGAAQRAAYRAVAGNLKLAYSQFEELEAFARFGTRLDESTRQIIDHGQRIRACLKQPESQPVPMIEQITVLLALTAGLFDRVPLEKVADAEKALAEGDGGYPGGHRGRLTSADKLSDADRKAILDIATHALASFQPAPTRNRRRTQDQCRATSQGGTMSGTMESLGRKIAGAEDLEGVVRSMKALAASSIGQYEKAVESLDDYYRTVELGIDCVSSPSGAGPVRQEERTDPREGSDRRGCIRFGPRPCRPVQRSARGIRHARTRGLARQNNENLGGRRARSRAHGRRRTRPAGPLSVPTSVDAITPLVGQILIEIEAAREQGDVVEVHLFHNHPKSGAAYEPVGKRLLPLDHAWQASSPQCPGRRRICRRSSKEPRRRLRLSFGNTSLFCSFKRAPNPWPAKTPAVWRRCNARKKTSRYSRKS